MPIVVIPNNLSLYVVTVVTAVVSYPEPPDQGLIYLSKGDRWDNIAYQMYGDATQVGPLLQNNGGILMSDYVPAGSPVFAPLIPAPVVPATTTPWA